MYPAPWRNLVTITLMEPPSRRTPRMITAAGETRSFARKDGGELPCRVFALKSENCRAHGYDANQSIRGPNFISLRAGTVLLYIPTRPPSSLSRIISRKFSKLVRPPRKVLTRSILRRSERRRYRRRAKGFLGMLDDVLLTVSHVLFLESPFRRM